MKEQVNSTAVAMRRKAAEFEARGGKWLKHAEEMLRSADRLDPKHALCGVAGCVFFRHRTGPHSWDELARENTGGSVSND